MRGRWILPFRPVSFGLPRDAMPGFWFGIIRCKGEASRRKLLRGHVNCLPDASPLLKQNPASNETGWHALQKRKQTLSRPRSRVLTLEKTSDFELDLLQNATRVSAPATCTYPSRTLPVLLQSTRWRRNEIAPCGNLPCLAVLPPDAAALRRWPYR